MPGNSEAPQAAQPGKPTAQPYAFDYGQCYSYQPAYHASTHPSPRHLDPAIPGPISLSVGALPQYAQGAQPWPQPSSPLPPELHTKVPSWNQWPRYPHAAYDQQQPAVTRPQPAGLPETHVVVPLRNAPSALTAPVQATLWGGVVAEGQGHGLYDRRPAKRPRTETTISQYPTVPPSYHFTHIAQPKIASRPATQPSGTQADPFLLESSPERSKARPAKKRKSKPETPAYGEPKYSAQDSQAARQLLQATKQALQNSNVQGVPIPRTSTVGVQPPQTTIPGEPLLCKEQADLVDLIMSGKNVFYTGSAGCGKSTVLKAFVKRFEETGRRVRILAPTGRAALAVNGTTTWSYVGWVPGHHKKPIDELLELANGKTVWTRLHETDVLVIDEISMVENLHFERLNAFLKKGRRSNAAFGGVQLVVTGDFCQLPPVKPFQHCIHCGKDLVEVRSKGEYRCKEHGVYYEKDKWAFRSKAWQDCRFTHVELTHIHRQSDKVFIDILQKLRIGRQLSATDLNILLNHETKGMSANAVKLFGSRAEVDRVNFDRFTKLRTKPRTYKCLDDFRWNEKHFNLESKGRVNEDGVLLELDKNEHRYSARVHLKKGMAVVLLSNLDIGHGLVNGAQGVIQGFKRYVEVDMPKAARRFDKNGKSITAPNTGTGRTLAGDYATYREDQVQQFMKLSETQELPEVRFQNGQCLMIYPDCTVNEMGDSKPYTLLARTQIPLTAGYAITTHKSQGMTLDKVEVDLSKTFEAGQAYVALSRARSLDGLKVVSFPKAAQIGADPQVQEFLREKFPESFKKIEGEAQ